MRRIEPYFPLSHGVPRVDDRRIVSGIIFVVRNGLRWRDTPARVQTAQDNLQPVHPLEPTGRVQQDLCGPGGEGWQAGPIDDRCDASPSPPHGRRACSKRGCSLTYRTHQGWRELEAPCHLRREGQAADHAAQRRADERLQRCCADGRCPTQRQSTACRSRLRRRLVPRCPGRAAHLCLHPLKRLTAKSRSRTTPRSTASDTRSRSCLADLNPHPL